MYPLLVGGREVAVPKSRRVVLPKVYRSTHTGSWAARELEPGLLIVVPVDESKSIDDLVDFKAIHFAEKGRIKRCVSYFPSGEHPESDRNVYIAGAGESVLIDVYGESHFKNLIRTRVKYGINKKNKFKKALIGTQHNTNQRNLFTRKNQIQHHGKIPFPEHIRKGIPRRELYVDYEMWYDEQKMIRINLLRPEAVIRYIGEEIAECKRHKDPNVTLSDILEVANLTHSLRVVKINEVTDKGRMFIGLPREGLVGNPVEITPYTNWIEIKVYKEVVKEAA
jgi:hypothetical protein